MNFRTLKAAIVNILGEAADGRFQVIGYQQQAQSAENIKNNGRTVKVFYKQGVFPKSAGSLNGPVQHDTVFFIEISVSSASKGDLSALEDPTSTAEELKTALANLKIAEGNADDKFDELADIVYNILMDARNVDLGLEPVHVGTRWAETIVKDEIIARGSLVVLTGSIRLTARMVEEIVGDTGHPLEVIDSAIEVFGDPSIVAGSEDEYEFEGAYSSAFLSSDFFNGKVLVANMREGLLISEVVLIIEDEFDPEIQLTIGDPDAQGRLMAAAENYPSAANKYKKDVDYKYEESTPIYLYVSETPNRGNGRVLIYASREAA